MVLDIINENEKAQSADKTMEVLHRDFPQCFNSEGKFDLAAFSELLKDKVDLVKEGSGFNFLGKNYASLLASMDTTTVLVPDIEHNSLPENANSQNVYISGDNLDALKHLVKSYAGKVKCIYIDPPYNTGSDGFVYNDKFKFTAEELEEKLSISEEQANRIIAMTTRGAASHSAWLTFMMPRLLYAKDLLSDDGVIFISIDDNEQANLKLLCDYVFGEENMICSFIWKKRQNVDSRTQNGASKDHDYLICYGRNNEGRVQGKESDKSKYSNPDNDPRGDWMSADMTGLANESQRPNLHYALTNPATGITYECPSTGWRYERKRMDELIANGEILFPKDMFGRPRRKKFLKDVESQYTGLSSVLDTVFSTHGTRELRELFDGADVFDFPKPVDFIKLVLGQGLNPSESDELIVVDFFSGSATTAQAVLQYNAEHKDSKVNFIMVQWKEEFVENSEAYKLGYRTIDQLGQERIRRAAAKIKSETNADIDYGFKHYTLQEPDDNTLDRMEKFEPLDAFGKDLLTAFGKDTVLSTYAARDGYGLTPKIEPVKFGNYTAYLCGKHLYLIDAEFNIDRDDLTELVDKYNKDHSFTADNVVIFGYSFNFCQTDAIKKNLGAITDRNRINIDIRY